MAGERFRIRAIEQRVTGGIDGAPLPIVLPVPVTTDHVQPSAVAMLHRLYRLRPQTIELFYERERIIERVEHAAASGDDGANLAAEVGDIERRIGPPRPGDLFIDGRVVADHAASDREVDAYQQGTA